MARKASQYDYVPLGSTPPNAIEIEANVLGCLLAYPKSFINVSAILSVDVFYKDSHKEIYQSIVNVYNERDTCDAILVMSDLDKRGKLSSIGGAAFLASLTDAIVSDTNLVFWAKALLDKYILREQINMGVEQIRFAYGVDADATQGLQLVSRNADKISSIWISKNNTEYYGDAVEEMLGDLVNRCENAKNNKLTGVKTPLKGLDLMLNGWQKSDLIILAARPSAGKTSVALNAAYEAAKAGTPVKFYSLEMSRKQLMYKLLLTVSGVDADNVRMGTLTQQEWAKINLVKEELKRLPITIDDTAGATPEYIYASTRLDVNKGKCGIVFIDYLGLIDYHMNGNTRNDDVGTISRRFKMMAKSLNIPVVLLSQLSRKVEDTPSKRPQLQHIRESGSVEQDADIVIFIYRPEMYDLVGKDGNEIKGVGQLIVAKHRNGSLGDVYFGYNPSMTRIWDVNRDNPNPVIKKTDDPF